MPLQCARPATAVQQARGPPLERFEPSPIALRFDHAVSSPHMVSVKPAYMKEKVLFPDDEIESNQSGVSATKGRSKARKPLSWFGLFSFAVLAVAALHLINLGNKNAAQMRSNSTTGHGTAFFLRSKRTFSRSKHRALVSEGRGQPRIGLLYRRMSVRKGKCGRG